MPAPAETGDGNIWTAFWWAVSGYGALLAGGFMYLLRQIGTNGRDGILLEIEKRFATKGDFDRMEVRIAQTMRELLREHENNVQRDIDHRVGRNMG